ncbi:recombination-associated protein RdgC [Neisseriaceae bacterium ESL0693]|nr:recombination-associated protein RdgC [Neisseriaceae bacterium ESL0693]
MWFKNLIVYRLSNIDGLTNDKLAAALAAFSFSPCTDLSWNSTGFTAPVDFNPDMLFATENAWRIALKTESKVLPNSVIQNLLTEKVQNIREVERRSVSRKEKSTLKENIIDDLLPRAFTKSRKTEAILNLNQGLLLVNEANANRAEMLLTKLRKSLGGLEAHRPRTQNTLCNLMTHWLLQGHAAGQFALDRDCELKGFGDSAPVVRINRQNLTAEEIISLVKNEKMVTQLGLCWQNRVRFILTQDFTLKQIQFLGVVQEERGQAEDMESMMFVSQSLMTEVLCNMLEELVKLLGGFKNG